MATTTIEAQVDGGSARFAGDKVALVVAGGPNGKLLESPPGAGNPYPPEQPIPPRAG